MYAMIVPNFSVTMSSVADLINGPQNAPQLPIAKTKPKISSLLRFGSVKRRLSEEHSPNVSEHRACSHHLSRKNSAMFITALILPHTIKQKV